MNEKFFRFSLLILLNIKWDNQLTDNELLAFGITKEQLKYKGMESAWSEFLRPLAVDCITNTHKANEDKVRVLEEKTVSLKL